MGTQYDSDEDLLDTPDTPSEQRPSLKRKLLKSKTPSRKKLDDIFPITKKGDTTPSTLSEPTLPIDIVVHEFETKPVDVEALRSGMVRFRFLLHGFSAGFHTRSKDFGFHAGLGEFKIKHFIKKHCIRSGY